MEPESDEPWLWVTDAAGEVEVEVTLAEPAAAQGRVAVVPATFGWDDVGDFSSLAEMLPAEANQPKVLGDHQFGAFFRSACTKNKD